MSSVDNLVREYLKVEDGALIWAKSPARKIKPGQAAGTKRPDGYVGLKLFGHRLLAHRVVVFLLTGSWPVAVDHKKGKANHQDNLRSCTLADNQQNRGKQSNNTTGVKGLSQRGDAWYGQIVRLGKTHTKQSKDRALVEEWLLATRAELAGEFTHD